MLVAHETPVATICRELVGNTCHYHVDNTWKCVDKYHIAGIALPRGDHGIVLARKSAFSIENKLVEIISVGILLSHSHEEIVTILLVLWSKLVP